MLLDDRREALQYIISLMHHVRRVQWRLHKFNKIAPTGNTRCRLEALWPAIADCEADYGHRRV